MSNPSQSSLFWTAVHRSFRRQVIPLILIVVAGVGGALGSAWLSKYASPTTVVVVALTLAVSAAAGAVFVIIKTMREIYRPSKGGVSSEPPKRD